MRRRMVLSGMTAACLSGLYCIYALIVGPLVDSSVGPRTKQNIKVNSRPIENLKLADRWLARAPWAADAKYQMRDDETIVYFEEWENIEPGESVRFTPFAMVWLDEDPQKEPVTIVSESAVIKFQKPFSVSGGNPGRPIGGALHGDVHIQGADGLDVRGRNFFFAESAMRVWSGNRVKFTHGPHRGTAEGVQIELLPVEGEQDADKIAVGGVRSIRLQRNVHMILMPGDTFTKAKTVKKDSGKRGSGKKKPVDVYSDGSFEFVLDTNTATFEDNVRIDRPTEPGKFDRLRCHDLTLIFEPDPAAGDQTSPPDDEKDDGGFRGIDGKLVFRRMLAEGDDVVLISEMNELTAHMIRLEYDGQTKVAALYGKETVHVLRGQSELHSPEITIVHDDEGEVSSVDCRGAGRMKSIDRETGRVQLAGEWEKGLRQYSEPDSGLEVIELEQNALVRQPDDDMALAADFIKLWFDRNGTKRSERGKDDKGLDAGEFRPQRMLAIGDVVMTTPELQLKTKRLETWFEEKARSAERGVRSVSWRQPAPLFAPTSALRTPRFQLFASVDDPLGNATVGKATVGKATVGKATVGKATVNDEPTDGPVKVEADLVRVLVFRDSELNKSEVSQVWTQGNVQVEQDHGPDIEPLKLTGDILHMKKLAEDQQVLHVKGDMAHIRDRGMHIEGREIHLDQQKNVAWVTGSGLLQLPVNRDLEGKLLAEAQLLDVRWTEKMIFDGRLAHFFGNVRSKLTNNRMNCQEMQVLLTKKMSFIRPDEAERDGRRRRREPKAEIQRVLCQGGVHVDSYEYEQDKLVGIRRAKFFEFSINQTTGKTHARGPGSITAWRHGRGNRASLALSATARANKPLESDDMEWEYLRVDFTGRTDGNSKQRFTTFYDDVNVVYGPVDRPLVTIDPDELPKDGGWMRCQELTFTQHEKTELRKAYIELFGRGNAELEGRMFYARADTISYDESKGLYVLKSLGNRDATIWRQKIIGGKRARTVARRMEFIPSRDWLKLDRTRSGSSPL